MVRVCHAPDKVKMCDQGVAGGKAKLICHSISMFFLALTIIVYIMEKSIRYVTVIKFNPNSILSILQDPHVQPSHHVPYNQLDREAIQVDKKSV